MTDTLPIRIKTELDVRFTERAREKFRGYPDAPISEHFDLFAWVSCGDNVLLPDGTPCIVVCKTWILEKRKLEITLDLT